VSAEAARTFDPMELDGATDWLLDGGLLVIPTESWYAVAADPRSPAAVDAVFRCKGRPTDRPLPLLAGDRQQVQLAAPGWLDLPNAARLADTFWPGPLALILPASRGVAPGVLDPRQRLAIRCSAHPLASGLARLFGFPLTATSANRTGAPPARDPHAAVASLALSGRVALLDGGQTAGGAPSTIVDPATDPPDVLREGAIDVDAIRRCLFGERA